MKIRAANGDVGHLPKRSFSGRIAAVLKLSYHPHSCKRIKHWRDCRGAFPFECTGNIFGRQWFGGPRHDACDGNHLFWKGAWPIPLHLLCLGASAKLQDDLGRLLSEGFRLERGPNPPDLPRTLLLGSLVIQSNKPDQHFLMFQVARPTVCFSDSLIYLLVIMADERDFAAFGDGPVFGIKNSTLGISHTGERGIKCCQGQIRMAR